ncbi:hypothetical protein [Tissierella pigra]|uniref:Uncharacterized protein n=1 Tax=Tissierella pigra TaxID=2607614 RepID=A0A6N7Y3I6_9FIRM|nr:hypothetical protein [Tissierella pigra]MSU03444.1 hypothetical protein [Tissierella pigra]
MPYYVMFMVEREDISSRNMASIFADYSWWVDLVKKFLNKADTFETRVWSEDGEAIESGIKYGKKIDNEETREIVFQGKVTNDFEIEVKENFLSKEGFVKWFTLNLYNGKKLLFSSQHYGDETLIFDLSEEGVDQIQEWAKQYRIIKRVDVYEITN